MTYEIIIHLPQNWDLITTTIGYSAFSVIVVVFYLVAYWVYKHGDRVSGVMALLIAVITTVILITGLQVFRVFNVVFV